MTEFTGRATGPHGMPSDEKSPALKLRTGPWERVRHQVSNRARDQIEQNSPLRNLISGLQNSGKVVVFGGFLRDIAHNLLNKDSIRSRDIDLVVDGTLDVALPHTRRTRFGGTKGVLPNGTIFSYWELENTYAFRRRLLTANLSNLAASADFTINAIVLDLDTWLIHDDGALSDIVRRTIRFQCPGYFDFSPEFYCFRAIDFAIRLGYRLDDRARKYVRSNLQSCGFEAFHIAGASHNPEYDKERLKFLYQAALRLSSVSEE